VTCGSCGTVMTHTYTPKKKAVYRYYVCLNAPSAGLEQMPHAVRIGARA
jgi:hypothetical protein